MQIRNLKPDDQLEFHSENDLYFCEGVAVDLRDSPLSSKLFSLFTLYPNEVIRKADILAVIYNLDVSKKYSKRFMDTYVHNAVKLVSRARRQASRSWGQSDKLRNFQWFCFDNIAGGWRLYLPKEEQISMLDVV